MTRTLQLLICDDNSDFHLAVKQSLKGKCVCRSAYNSDEAVAIVRQNPIDIVLLDIEMRSRDEGLDAISALKREDPDLVIVMSSGRKDFATVREAMRRGAVDYIEKDCDPEELSHALTLLEERKALLRRAGQQDFEARSQQKRHLLVGNSPPIRELRRVIEKIRRSPANVVIFGETGTGKEVVARQLRGQRADGSLAPFVAVDSATIQAATAESLLFGHEKGAFTGAERQNRGIFEEADGGLVYFDEIANMPLEIQAKLLRVIQEKELVRMGSSKVIQCDFRVICATNRDLEAMVAAREFKEDLWQRLNVLPIVVPPLRERKEDIPLLVEHFIERAGRGAAGQQDLHLTPDALEALQDYPWPGNVRELGNLIAYLVTMAENDEVDMADLPAKFRPVSARSAAPAQAESFYERISRHERELLQEEYRRHSGQISKMASSLGMDRSHLYTKLKEHGIYSPKS